MCRSVFCCRALRGVIFGMFWTFILWCAIVMAFCRDFACLFMFVFLLFAAFLSFLGTAPLSHYNMDYNGK